MTKEENIATLNEHLDHWKRLLSEKICDQSEGEKTIDALQNAIKALEQEPTDVVDRVTIKEYLDGFGKDINVAATDCISRKSVSGCVRTMYYKGLGKQASLEYILKYVERLPSVSPQPKMGAWEWLSYEGIDEGNWHCSECRMIIPRMPIDDDGKPLYKCCPYCGSKKTND